MREVVAITDLIGRGDDPQMADWMVESWEVSEGDLAGILEGPTG